MTRILLTVLFALAWTFSPAGAFDIWTNRSAEIPNTVLDPYRTDPYFTIASGRGKDWLAGNSNQLFHVLSDRILDLTPALAERGFKFVRQVATDGSGWLVIGDSSLTLQHADLAFHYDGMYWKDARGLLNGLSPAAWIGDISGMHGLWILPGETDVRLWHDALDTPAQIPYPPSFREPHEGSLEFYPVHNGWIATFAQKNGAKTMAHGQPRTDRRFFFFDGQSFSEQTASFQGLSGDSALGTRGDELLVFGLAYAEDHLNPIPRAFLADGARIRPLPALQSSLSRQAPALFSGGMLVWDGIRWNFFNAFQDWFSIEHDADFIAHSKTRDIFFATGYGLDGNLLLAGYQIDPQNNIIPTLVTRRME